MAYEFKHETPQKFHDAFKVVAYGQNGKGTIVREQLPHQFQHKEMLYSNFGDNLIDVENTVIKFKALRFLAGREGD